MFESPKHTASIYKQCLRTRGVGVLGGESLLKSDYRETLTLTFL